MATDTQSRQWFLTINHPVEAGLTHDVIIDKLTTLGSIQYMCMADEIGEKGTPHTHIYIKSSSNIRFSTLQKRFPVAHIESCRGSSKENRDYVRKEGKYADSKKVETKVEGTFFERGECPKDDKNDYPEVKDLMNKLLAGVSIKDIVIAKPSFALKVGNLEKLKTHLEEQYLEMTRDVKVTYIYDKKDKFNLKQLFEEEGYKNVCCINEYPDGKSLFDAYNGHNVLIFTEFEGQIPINTMIHYLDGLPKYLPARYYNRVACYTKVYIISRYPMDEVYPRNGKEERFINKINEYIDMDTGQIIILTDNASTRKGDENG